MITQASDYQLITPVGRIDGSILPARDVRGNGRDHVLCAEDLCFAMEAVAERNLANQALVIGYPSAPSLVLRRKDWNRIWYQLRDQAFTSWVGTGYAHYGAHAIDPSEPFADINYTACTSIPDFDDLYPNAKLSTCYSAPVENPVLDQSKMWRGFYFDLLRADCLLVDNVLSQGIPGCGYSGSYTRLFEGGTSTSYTVSDAGSFPAFNLKAVNYSYDSSSGLYTRDDPFGVTAADMTCVVPQQARVSAAKLVVIYKLSASGANDSAGSGTMYYFVRSYDCGVSSTVITIPSSSVCLLDFDLAAAAESLGHEFPSTTSNASAWGVWPLAQLVISSAHLVVTYAFRTSIRSLNWQWTP